MDVGFIGLGHMGSGMALCLLKAGHRLKVYNRSRDKAEKLAAEGAVVVDQPGDACRGDAVITMLAGAPTIVTRVADGPPFVKSTYVRMRCAAPINPKRFLLFWLAPNMARIFVRSTRPMTT